MGSISRNSMAPQFIREGGLILRAADCSPWKRAWAIIFGPQWEQVDGRCVDLVLSARHGDREDFACLLGADVEVCRLTGDRRFGHASVYLDPESVPDKVSDRFRDLVEQYQAEDDVAVGCQFVVTAQRH
jgi:hypothetical protein